MTLSAALSPEAFRLRDGSVPVVAFAGGGGKTTALFALAGELAGSGERVLVTTTTHIRDPRAEGRFLDAFLEVPELARGRCPRGAPLPDALRGFRRAAPGSVTVLCPGVKDGKLLGVDPESFSALARSGLWGAVLVEADGSKGRAIKAPAAHEPVWPLGATVAIGMVGLDCLGRPLDGGIAHRPELLGAVAGLEAGEPITETAVLRLALHPDGLFKSAPESALRVLALNKADEAWKLEPEALARRFAEGLSRSAGLGPRARIDLVLVCALAEAEPGRRVLAARAVSSLRGLGVYWP